MTTIALRPYLPADTPVLIITFREAVLELTVDDYDEDQRDAWSAAADDEEAFGKRLEASLTLIATIEGNPVGFISLKDNSTIDLLYVHPDFSGVGVAKILLEAIEKLAAARGATELISDVSDTARGFFEKYGYSAQQRNTVLMEGEWLANTTMKKTFAGSSDTVLPGNLTRH
ncbi:MAG: GNAT family N-acetyltransferase [Beijerinckiaceae bacterium]|jgi:putative acetyltransferase|nr:GNAT family N-acetyltransferase [Beijerinckiaceae bacterium]